MQKIIWMAITVGVLASCSTVQHNGSQTPESVAIQKIENELKYPNKKNDSYTKPCGIYNKANKDGTVEKRAQLSAFGGRC
ncbi:hypothetical protein [Acinetobacter rathckeae]|uniref:hypothetical protein n=1 Tax=Acinetobacter rathckeae TaxID=2605272 RepID=UPI0018A2EB0B|nr:hypothetical protein [Acinetobacter rathckeae]MBF7695405.1 hypothetical protein [Acinetobacter rathckeae]